MKSYYSIALMQHELKLNNKPTFHFQDLKSALIVLEYFKFLMVYVEYNMTISSGMKLVGRTKKL